MESAKRPWLSLIVLCLGTFAVLLDGTIVNVALPSVLTGLHASLDQALWVVNVYLLVFAALLIFASRLGDMFGPRRLFTVGLALFATASALCGAAQAPGQLIAARALQGVGAALLTPQAMVIIQAVFPRACCWSTRSTCSRRWALPRCTPGSRACRSPWP
jgi:MFS family permease